MELSPARSLNGKSYGAVDTLESVEEGDHQPTPTTVDVLPSTAVSEAPSEVSIHDMHRSVAIPGRGQSWWSKLMAYAGPGALVAVGYMDPGNWTTDIGGGSAYNYDLLFVVLWSSVIAMFFQLLSVKLAIATGKDLAQACKEHYSTNVSFLLWAVAEVAIIATDLAEVLGCAIAMQLLFGWRLEIGVLVTGFDVAIVFLTQGSRIRMIELLVLLLIIVIMASFCLQLILSQPEMGAVLYGMAVPKLDTFTDSSKLFVAVGILGATIMPHSLFLHSNMVLTRSHELTIRGKKEALRFAFVDVTASLACAFFVNASILIVAAATFYEHGYHTIASLYEASALLDPLLGSQYAAIAFGIALLASGLNSTLTGTMAGQIVMEGFIDWKVNPMWRRFITRALAILPAMAVIVIGGQQASNDLLIMSQVILSFALPFAVYPLVQLTSDEGIMGTHFVNSTWQCVVAYFCAVIITGLNVMLIYLTFAG